MIKEGLWITLTNFLNGREIDIPLKKITGYTQENNFSVIRTSYYDYKVKESVEHIFGLIKKYREKKND